MEIDLLKSKVIHILNNSNKLDIKIQDICNFLNRTIDHYNWVGFYFKNGERKELKLAQFAGKQTEHTIIPFGKGICGQVALSNQTFVVQDVSLQNNYISCGIDVKSEIVVPIIKNGINIGQIDIDSHQESPFTIEDEKFLEFICKQISNII